MPTLSRNRRHHARTRRTNSLLKRELRGLSQNAQKSFAMLLAVLAQAGGEVTIVQGTLDQVLPNLATLGYEVVKGQAENEHIVRMVTQQAASGTLSASVDTTPADPTMAAGDPA
jgi:hypothetical protein